jgi:hypothetical protein
MVQRPYQISSWGLKHSVSQNKRQAYIYSVQLENFFVGEERNTTIEPKVHFIRPEHGQLLLTAVFGTFYFNRH